MKKKPEVLPNYLQDEIFKRINNLKLVLDYANKELEGIPEGKLYVAPGSTPNAYRYYTRNEYGEKIYLSATQRKRKQELSKRKYYETVSEKADKEMRVLQKTLLHLKEDSLLSAYRKVGPGVTKWVNPILESDEDFRRNWECIPYSGLEFAKEDTTEFYTDKGERVRSKSEVLIANTLLRENIPYRYEFPFDKGYGNCLYPDFTVLRLKDRKEFLWEHWGLMDEAEYVEHNMWKLDAYKAQGIFLGVNLIVSYESKRRPLGTREVKMMIEHYLK